MKEHKLMSRNKRLMHVLRAAPRRGAGRLDLHPASPGCSRVVVKTRDQNADEKLAFEQALSVFLVEWVVQETRRKEKRYEKSTT